MPYLAACVAWWAVTVGGSTEITNMAGLDAQAIHGPFASPEAAAAAPVTCPRGERVVVEAADDLATWVGIWQAGPPPDSGLPATEPLAPDVLEQFLASAPRAQSKHTSE